jgi:hypothetical protein
MIGDGTYVYAAPFPNTVNKPPTATDINIYLGDQSDTAWLIARPQIASLLEQLAAKDREIAEARATIRILSEVLRELAVKR